VVLIQQPQCSNKTENIFLICVMTSLYIMLRLTSLFMGIVSCHDYIPSGLYIMVSSY
jgi:hypothetical protein